MQRTSRGGLATATGLSLALALIGLIGTSAAPRSALADPPETYPLSKVKRGQKGYGMTTFAGTTPERFEFEIVGVAKNFLPMLDIIIVKSDDPKLAVTGFWQGMSGSPLYLDGKLLCAFSYGFPFNKVALGGCTPIEAMKKEGFETPIRATDDTVDRGGKKPPKGKRAAAAGQPRALPTQVATMDDWKRLTASGSLDDAFATMAPPRQPWLLSTAQAILPARTGDAAAAPAGDAGDEVMTASVPLAFAGFSAPAFAEIEAMFAGYPVEPVRAGGTGGASADGPTEFQMGASISVVLIRGDMSAAATGTVSYVDGHRVLAFGHPMFQTGETYMPVATAEVIGVVASARSAFVLAQPINEIGALVQDRQSMIMADTDLRHPMIPVDIYVDAGTGDQKTRHEFHVDVLNNKYWTGSLAGAAAMNAIDVFLPDRDSVTARIESTVKLAGLPEMRFTDYLNSTEGARGVVGGARGLRVLTPLLLNPWAPVKVDSVEVKVDLSFDTNYGDIVELRVPSGELAPGKKHTVEVVLETHGGKRVVDKVPFEIPASLAGQIITMEVTAGDGARLDAAPPVDADSLVAALRQLLPGNVYAVTLYGASEGVAIDGIAVKDLPASALDKLYPQTTTQNVASYRPLARTTSPSKRVVNGGAAIMVRVAAPTK